MGAQKVDTEKAIRLKTENGLSYADIAAIQGVSKSGVHKAIQALIPTEAELALARQFKAHEADITALKRAQVLSMVDEATLKRWCKSFPSAAVLFYNSTYNNERLERGQSTQNIAYNAVDMAQKMRELREMLAEAEAGVVDV